MKVIVRAFVFAILLGAANAAAQAPPPPQLDQLLAPIALYPDPLLGEILMAATYPLEVVEADRWLRAADNTALTGPQLTAALEPLPWDPSVKSLAAFPQVLHMMDVNLDWTEQLGNAFLADQPAVMASVQRLRTLAAATGKLASTPQQVVTTAGPVITIEPVSPDTVYVPVYSPLAIYGTWPYPAFPPYYFPGYFQGFVPAGIGFGWFATPVIAPLWGWVHWDWRQHRIDLDRDRFANLNLHHQPIGSGAWEHDPSHRHGVPYADAVTRERFQGVAVSPDMRRSIRGFPAPPVEQSRSGLVAHLPQVVRPQASSRPPTTTPTTESYGRGAEVRKEAERGQASRTSRPPPPVRPAPRQPAPTEKARRP